MYSRHTTNDPPKISPRTLGAFLAGLYGHPSFAALRAADAGLIVAWARLMLSTGRMALPLQEAADHAAHFARASEPEFNAIVGSLKALRLITLEGADLSLPTLTAAMLAQSDEKSRRATGWEKRRKAPQAARPASASFGIDPLPAAAPAPQATPAKPTVDTKPPVPVAADPLPPLRQPALECNVTDAAPAPATKPAIKPPKPDTHLRVSDTAADRTPVVVTMPIKGGKVAEFTEGYVARMKQLHPTVDVLLEIRKAAQWCEENESRRKTGVGVRRFVSRWLTTAGERQATRRAVIEHQHSRNGFGNGGAAPTRPAPAGRDDDLADLLPPARAFGQRSIFSDAQRSGH